MSPNLADFLCRTLAPDELRRLVSNLSGGADLVADLPERATPAQLAHEVVHLLSRRGRLDAEFFEALTDLPGLSQAKQAEVRDLAASILGKSPRKEGSSPWNRRRALGISLGFLGVVAATSVAWWAWDRPPSPQARTLPVTVVLFHDGPGIPKADDLAGTRTFLGRTLLPALVEARVGAILLDFGIRRSDDATPDLVAALGVLGEGIRAARAAGIPVVAVQPPGGRPGFAVCAAQDPQETCLDALVDARLDASHTREGPKKGVPVLVAWPGCPDTLPSLAYVLAWYGSKTTGKPSCVHGSTVLPPLPASPCHRPYARAWVAEVLGSAFTGPDPADGRTPATCAPPELAGRTVVVGDARWVEGSGADALTLASEEPSGYSLVAGAEAAAFAAASMVQVSPP